MKPLLAAVALALTLAACTKGGTPAAGPSTRATGSDEVVAVYGEKKITLGELDANIAKELYRVRRQGLETMIVRSLMQAEAAKLGKTEEQYLDEIASRAVAPMGEAELRQIYEENKAAFGDAPFEQAKQMIQQRYQQEKEREGMMTFFTELKAKAGVKITLSEPRTQVAATGPSKGPENAPVTIVEFSDFECPFCSDARKTADQVVAAFAGKVRLVFRDYPLPFHSNAQKAAEAGQCAHEQGKFWEMHDWMFGHQDKLDVASLKEGAKSLQLDSAKFDSCLDSGKFTQQVKDSQAAGQEAGVSGTPAFFINGRMISGAQPIEKFKEMIEAELAPK